MLEKIDYNTIQYLTDDERRMLCDDLRREIIDTVRSSGGHLASNLGVVELTVALCSVFDFKKDKVVFDVGHQCYAYKLLTDRKDRFSTLRKFGGISGFPKRSESKFDSYDTGHAGNSVSAAIGIAKARDLKKEDYDVIAVIGDGSFNNGLIYEALNSLPILNTNILIVLNDNDMSISPTVGGMHDILTKTEGKENSVKLIEQYGVKYLSIANGNDERELIEVLKTAKEELKKGSLLLHVKTKKGMGYAFCEENPTMTHGVAPEGAKTTEEYSSVFGKKMLELGLKNDKTVVVTAAMTDALGLRPFFDKYPERAFDVGICEENAAVLCAAMASNGLKPYYAIYSTFLQRAFDEIIHDVCCQDLPVTFCIDRGGVSGSDGETHQGVFDLSYLSLVPNMAIAVPKDKDEFNRMLDFSLEYAHPLAIRYPRSATYKFGKAEKIELGKFEYLNKIDNAKVTVLAAGERSVKKAFNVLEMTDQPFDIINARFIKPLDKELLSAIKSGVIVTIEDNVKCGGLGDQILRFYSENGTDKRIKCFAYDDRFIEQGSVAELQEIYGLRESDIIEFVNEANK